MGTAIRIDWKAAAAFACLLGALISAPVPCLGAEGDGGGKAKESGAKPQDGGESPDMNFGWFVSDWGRKVLANTDLAASGSVGGVWRLPKGSTLAFFKIDAVRWGGTADKSVIVLTPDPNLFAGGEKCLIFLKRISGSRYEPVDVLGTEGEESRSRLAACLEMMDIEKLPTYLERIALFKDMLLRNIGVEDRWIKANALRELFILSKNKPRIFTAANLASLEERLSAERKEEAGKYLLSIVTHIQVLPPLMSAVTPAKEGDTVEGVAKLAALLNEKGISDRRRRFREEAVFDRFREEADSEVRERIVRVVGYMPSPRLSNGLVRAMLSDVSPGVRAASAGALASFADSRPAVFLLQALRDPMPAVALSAARSLGMIGDKSAADGLRKFLETPGLRSDVREAAGGALKALGG